jgi:hypothetical protein
MQMDPTLCSSEAGNYVGSSTIEPALLKLGQEMAEAQAKKVDSRGEDRDREGKATSSQNYTSEGKYNSPVKVLEEFVSRIAISCCSDRRQAEARSIDRQIRTNNDFHERYRQADLAKSAALAVAENEALVFRSFVDAVSAPSAKVRTKRHSEYRRV